MHCKNFLHYQLQNIYKPTVKPSASIPYLLFPKSPNQILKDPLKMAYIGCKSGLPGHSVSENIFSFYSTGPGSPATVENENDQVWRKNIVSIVVDVGVSVALVAAALTAYFSRENTGMNTCHFACLSMEGTNSLDSEGTSRINGANVDKMKSWVCELKEEALQRGLEREVVERAFEDVIISETILEIDQNRPEVKLTAEEYLKRMVTNDRVSKGVAAFREHRGTLEEISFKYGVPAPVIVAIWGVESSYGAYTGGWDTIQALITMSYGRQESGKSKYFREETFNALSIIEQGHGPPGNKRLQGSYAGAMGQCQFMPSSFLSYAVDYDEDGRADIWESYKDIFASIANYLLKHGWKAGHPIAQRVTLEKDIDQSLLGMCVKKPLHEWKKEYNVIPMEENIEFFPDEMASLIAPDGLQADVYLVYDNFQAIMRYNTSVLYSISVYDLAQKILSGLIQDQ